VNVIHTFSDTLGEAVSLVPLPPAKAIFVGFDVVLTAASGVSSSYAPRPFRILGKFPGPSRDLYPGAANPGDDRYRHQGHC